MSKQIESNQIGENALNFIVANSSKVPRKISFVGVVPTMAEVLRESKN
jgi:hypothetical protein